MRRRAPSQAKTLKKRVFRLGEPVFPFGTPIFPNGKALFPSGKPEDPLGKRQKPFGKPDFPNGKPKSPKGKLEFPKGKSKFPNGNPTFPFGKSEFPSGKKRSERCENSTFLRQYPIALSLLRANYMVRQLGPMAHTNSTAEAIQQMVRFFLPRCADQSTLRELDDMASDDKKWRHAHDLFRRIRAKTLRAGSANDELLQAQYGFEEICAKTLFNMSPHGPDEGFPYPFDDDSPFWVIPIAVDFARALGVADPFNVSSLLQPRNARPS